MEMLLFVCVRSAPILQNGLVNWLVSFDSTVSPMVAFLLFMPLQMDCVCLFAHFMVLSFLCPLLFGLGFVLFPNWLTPLLIMQVQQLAIHAMLGLRLKQLAQGVFLGNRLCHIVRTTIQWHLSLEEPLSKEQVRRLQHAAEFLKVLSSTFQSGKKFNG
jgi:hypothetical protein